MLNNQEFYVQKEILKSGSLPEMDATIKAVKEYLKLDYFESKNNRLEEWGPDTGEIYEVVLAMFTVALTNEEMTYQAIVGMFASRISVKKHTDQIKIAAELVALAAQHDLLDIRLSGSGYYIMVTTSFEIPGIPENERHKILTEKPPVYEKNRHPENKESLILGGKQNHHEGDICLDHLNRMNAIQLKLNRPFLRRYEEAPTFAIKTKKQEEQWEYFIINSYRAYIKLTHSGNRFYLEHKVDKRGRTYACGYHITTQGSSFKKAIVQLAKEELVEG